MRVSPKLRVAALVGALAATIAAVRWADSLTDLQEASAGAVVGPVARGAPAAVAARDDAKRVNPAALSEGSARSDQLNIAAAPVKGDAPANADAPGALDLRKLQRPRSAGPSGDLFGPRDFRPAPPPVKRPIAQSVAIAQPAAPPPPMAPPLPFTYMGRLNEDGQTTVFLAAGDRNLVVKAGDVIDNTYRLDQVSDTAVVLTHLPTSMKQTLAIGAQ